MFQGSHGAEVRNMADQYIFNHFNSSQDFISTTPDQGFIKQKIFTNSIIQDASYVALRTINIGYTFPSSFTDKFKNRYIETLCYRSKSNVFNCR